MRARSGDSKEGNLDFLGDLGIKPKAMCMQGSYSTPELKLQPLALALHADCFIFT